MNEFINPLNLIQIVLAEGSGVDYGASILDLLATFLRGWLFCA
jgi:hypothetical protein